MSIIEFTASTVVRILYSAAKKKEKRPSNDGCGIGVPFGDTHALRLTSELVDLRAVYANPVLCGSAASTVVRILYFAVKKKEKRPSNDGLFSLAAE